MRILSNIILYRHLSIQLLHTEFPARTTIDDQIIHNWSKAVAVRVENAIRYNMSANLSSHSVVNGVIDCPGSNYAIVYTGVANM